MKQPKLGTRMLVTGAVVVAAIIASALLYLRLFDNPWTRDGRVTADVVLVAPRITGLVVNVPVEDNQPVRKGDVLFEIDPSDYEIMVATAVAQLDEARQQVGALEAAISAAEAGVDEASAGITTAEAGVGSARARVEAAGSQVSGNEAAVASARAAVARNEAAYEQAIRNRDRAARLAVDGAGSTAHAEITAAQAKEAEAALDGSKADLRRAEAALEQASAGLRQAQADLVSAEARLGEARAQLASADARLIQARADLGAPGEANSRIEAAKANLARAQLDLDRVTIRAPADGYVTNVKVNEGDYASPGAPLMAFVDGASFHVQGFFKETQLGRISPGDRAVVTLMSRPGKPIEGVVESVGWAINPPNIATTEGPSGLVPQVQPSFDWIRLAQRVPVRVRIDSVPDDVQLISGTTASVAIKPSD